MHRLMQQIIVRAFEEPIRQIAENTGMEGSVLKDTSSSSLTPERGQVVTHPCALPYHASVERDGLVRADECAAAAIDHQSGHEASA